MGTQGDAANPPPGLEAAVETVRAFLVHMRSGDVEEVKKLVAGDPEEMSLREPGPEEKLTFTLGEAELEGGAVVVPAELTFETPEESGTESMPFVCVATEEGVKVDMDLTMKRLMGISPDELLEGLAEGLSEVVEDFGESVEEAVEKTVEADDEEAVEEAADEEDDDAFGLYDPSQVSAEFSEGLDELEDEMERELGTIHDFLGEDLEWEIAWGSMPADGDAPQRLARHAIAPLRSALSSLNLLPGTPGDTLIERVRENLRIVRILCVNDERLCGCTLEDGVLVLTPHLGPGAQPHQSCRGLSADEIEWGIREALDLDVGPAIRESTEAVAELVDMCRERMDLDLTVEVDWESFREIPESKDAVRALTTLRGDLLHSLHYLLFDLHRESPLEGRLASLRLRHVGGVEERDVYVDGNGIVLDLWLVERGGGPPGTDLETVLPAMAAGLPSPDAPAEFREALGPGRDAEAYAAEKLPREVRRIQALLGEETPVSFRTEAPAEQAGAYGGRLVARGPQRVCGALGWLVQQGHDIEDLRSGLTEVAMWTVPDLADACCEVRDGVLRIGVSPEHGARGGYTESEIAEVVSDALGLRTRPLMRDLEGEGEKWADRLAGVLDVPLRYEFDWESFNQIERVDRVLHALTRLREYGIQRLYYALSDVLKDQKVRDAAARCVRILRLEHVVNMASVTIQDAGQALLLRLNLLEGGDGYFSADELRERLPDIIRMMDPAEDGHPEPKPEPEEGPAPEVKAAPTAFEKQVAMQKEHVLPTMTRQLNQTFRKEAPLQIDWDSFEEDEDHLTLVVQMVLGGLVGGLMMVLYDPRVGPAVSEAIREIHLRYDGTCEGARLTLLDHVLSVAAGGESSAFTPDPVAMSEEIKKLAGC